MSLDLTHKLSDNFTLGEMLRSATADSHGFAEQYTPEQAIVDALTNLCVNVLQPLRNALAAKFPGAVIKVNSGYRCARVNGLQPKASKSSQHMQGEAADIVCIYNGTVRNDLLVDTLINLLGHQQLPFDQVIWEFGTSASNPAWVHISLNSNGPQRRQQLRPKGGKYITYNLF